MRLRRLISSLSVQFLLGTALLCLLAVADRPEEDVVEVADRPEEDVVEESGEETVDLDAAEPQEPAPSSLLIKQVLATRVEAARGGKKAPVKLPTATECAAAGEEDLAPLLKDASPVCKEHLKKYYCNLVTEVVGYDKCLKMTDEESKLDFYECTRSKPFVSECNPALNLPPGPGEDPEKVKKQGPPPSGFGKKKPSVHYEVPGKIKIAFLIVAHRNNAMNVLILLKRIYDPAHLYFIHVDKKSPDAKKEIDDFIEEAHFEGASTFSEVDVGEGGNSLMRLSIIALQKMLAMDAASDVGSRWDYFVKLSESDYPITSPQALQEYLWAYKGNSLIDMHPCSRSLCPRHLGTNCGGQAYSFIETLKTHKPKTYRMVSGRGAEWVILTREFSQYVVDGLKEPGSLAALVYKDSLTLYDPNELFFHTLIIASPFCRKHVDRYHHFVDFSQDRITKRTHGTHDEIGTTSPADLRGRDLANIVQAKTRTPPKFFARKFDNLTDPDLADMRQRLAKSTRRWNKPHQESSTWTGLVDWFIYHWSEWRAKAEKKRCSAAKGADSSSTCAATSADYTAPKDVEDLGRLPFVKTGNAAEAAMDLRHAPEQWILQAGDEDVSFTEKVAVPERPTSHVGLALLSMRIGTDWNANREGFRGYIGVLPAAEVGRNLALSTYWARTAMEDVDKEYDAEAQLLAPDSDGKNKGKLVACGSPAKGKLGEEALKNGKPLVFQFDAQGTCKDLVAGNWSVRVRLNGGPGIMGSRGFLLYDSLEDVSLATMNRFFDIHTVDSE